MAELLLLLLPLHWHPRPPPCRGQDARWLTEARRSGTTQDRVAAMALLVQESAGEGGGRAKGEGGGRQWCRTGGVGRGRIRVQERAGEVGGVGRGGGPGEIGRAHV